MTKTAFAFFLPLVVAGLPAVAQEAPVPGQGATQEIWGNQWGGSVEDMTKTGAYKNGTPSRTAVVTDLDAGPHGEEYGARYTAILSTPKDGEYSFWISADDAAELWLSTDENPANLKKIAERKSYSSPKTFNDAGKSQPISLKQGKEYFLQVLHKQAGGGDHLTIAWQGNGMKQEILGGTHLKPVLNDKQKKALAETLRLDKRRGELREELKSQSERSIAGWLDKLPAPDKKLMAEVLKDDEKALAGKSADEQKSLLGMYASLAKGIVPTAENPVKNQAAKHLLYLEERYLESLTPEELKGYGPHRLAKMLGEIPEGVKPIKKTVSLDSKGDKWDREMVSTGVYALPGIPVTVTLPEKLATSGLVLIVGHHVNARVHQNPDLVGMPNTTRYFPLNSTQTTVTSPHGGVIFVWTPKEVELKKTPVTFDNVIESPRFFLGKTTNKAWKKIRNAPAPWGELISDNVLLLVKTDDLRKLDDPATLMKWWNENCRHHQDFYAYYPGFPFRMHASLYPREGYAYWPLEWHPKNMVRLLNVKEMMARNDGLFLHEHGHHGDFDEMIVGYWGESTCNWAGYYMKSLKDFDWKDTPDTHMRKLFDPNDKAHEEIKQEDWYKISTKGTHHWSYPITSMMLGYTADFGWKPFKETLRRMRNPQDAMYKWDFVQGDMNDREKRDQAKIDRYLIGLSEEAKRDVRPYFEHFKLRPSAGAAAYLDKKALPKWDLAYLPVSGTLSTPANTSLTIPQPEKTVLSMAGPVTIVWYEKTANGFVEKQENGDVIYTPRKGFTGEDQIAYVLKNSAGLSPMKFLPVQVKK